MHFLRSPLRSRNAASLFLALTVVGGVLPSLAPAHARQNTSKKGSKSAPKQVVLVFPPDAPEGKSDQLSEDILAVVRRRLTESGQYEMVLFSRSNPLVRRGIADQYFRPKETDPPYSTENARIRKITRLMGYNRALVSSVDSYEYDQNKGQVSLVISARLVDVEGDTAKPLRSVGDSLTGPKNASKEASELRLARDAARELTENIMTELLKPAKPADNKSSETKPDDKKPSDK